MSPRRALRLVAWGVLVTFAAVVAALLWVDHEMRRPHAGWSGASVDVVLEPGLDAGSMLAELAAAGVLRYPRLARAWLLARGGADRLHAGEYRFDQPISAREALRRLRAGDVLLHEITLPEGLTRSAVALRLEAAGFGSRAALDQAFSDPTPVLDLDPQAPDLEGYLYPETYHFPRGERAARIAAAMVGQFRRAVGEGYAERARAVGLTPRGAVTLASMIERETSLPAERARISAVFHNRLARGMKLECDPTVIYALARAGRETDRLTYDDLRFDSPWNTYVISGLPAGPIANPGRASLIAAVEPSESEELYFVAAPGGGHRFSRDLGAHLRAVAAWRRYVGSSR